MSDRDIQVGARIAKLRRKSGRNLYTDDCLWTECPVGKSTKEVRLGVATIRCCENEKCVEWAVNFAVKADEALGGQAS